MGRRIELQDALEEALGSVNVYYQPPENLRLKFPCIVYEKTPGYTWRADNALYRYKEEYTVTVIARDPDLPVLDTLRGWPLCRYDRRFTHDQLYHDVYSLYY